MVNQFWFLEWHFIISDEDEEASGETKPQQNNWMEQAEKRLELLKLRVEKEGKGGDDDEDDWDDSDCSDDGDFSDEDSSSWNKRKNSCLFFGYKQLIQLQL